MAKITIATTTIEPGEDVRTTDEAELAAVAFLARYSGRTLDAYRHDLRNLFQWAADHGLPVLEATRAHLEMYRSSMEERGLAPQPSTDAGQPHAVSTASSSRAARIRRSRHVSLR